MTEEKKQEISDAVIKDDLLPPPVEYCKCETCVLARLCDRQRDAITKLTEELEVERGRNRVLGFQIRTLREGK